MPSDEVDLWKRHSFGIGESELLRERAVEVLEHETAIYFSVFKLTACNMSKLVDQFDHKI